MKIAAIILNTPDEIAPVLENDVICADGGYKHLNGKKPLAVVGDFDSLTSLPDDVKRITYPVEKNETDGQLALDYALALGFDGVTIYGALGGKLEHILGNLGLLSYAAELGLSATIKEKGLTVELVSGTFTREVEKGDKISFFPFGGDVTVRRSVGLFYPLENLLLKTGTNRGISNIATAQTVGLDFSDGKLLYIRYLS